MEEGCWVSGVSKNGIVGAQGGPTLFGSHCTLVRCMSDRRSHQAVDNSKERTV